MQPADTGRNESECGANESTEVKQLPEEEDAERRAVRSRTAGRNTHAPSLFLDPVDPADRICGVPDAVTFVIVLPASSRTLSQSSELRVGVSLQNWTYQQVQKVCRGPELDSLRSAESKRLLTTRI